MRTVILIGNGFDIAHKAPTSFLDFSEYLIKEKLIPDLKKYILKESKSIYFNSTILNKSHNTIFPENDYSGSINWNLFGVFDFNKDKQYEILNRNLDYWSNHLSNKLLFNLFKEKSQYWFSIEDTFYRYLKIIYQKM